MTLYCSFKAIKKKNLFHFLSLLFINFFFSFFLFPFSIFHDCVSPFLLFFFFFSPRMAEISDDVGGSICVCHDGSMGVDGFWWVCDLI